MMPKTANMSRNYCVDAKTWYRSRDAACARRGRRAFASALSCGAWFRISSLGFRIERFGLRISSLGFRV